jgi:superfamily II DNA or RNA helicase
MIKVNRAILADKLYIHKDDLLESSFEEIIASYFTYKIVDEKPFINAYFDNDTGIFNCPIGSYRHFDIKEIIDQRPRLPKLGATTDIVLFPEQQEVADKFLKGDKLYSGLIVAPCSFGKSYLGAWLTVNYDKPAVIVVDTKLLAYQWLEVLQRHTNQEIGFIGDGKVDIKPITVAIYKTLLNNMDKVKNTWELAIIDEAHSCVAETFSQAVNNLNSRVNIALTATPWRKDRLHLALPDYFGPNVVYAKDRGQLPVKVFIKPIPIRFSVFNPKKEWSTELTKLCDNEKYIDIIQKDLK